MAYYIDTIEQIKGDNGTPTEYGKREKQSGTYEDTLTAYYSKLTNVSNDIGEADSKKHYYMDIRIVNSTGGVVKKDKVGKYQE